MNPNVSEWLNLIARWTHVFAGIMWVGSTYYFTWLDGRLTEEEAAAREGDKAQVWMVHSGGFYVVERERTPHPTRTLHWFRWEALTTWVSGMTLLIIVYYLGGALIDPDVRDISNHAAISISIGVLMFTWVAYDLLVRSPLGKNEVLFAVVGYLLIVGLIFGLTHVFSGRAAYIHLGAVFGTIMTSNVWMRILPPQRKMIEATLKGEQFDYRLAANAKLRSKHNTYMAVPLVFTMISNHFPTATYGSRNNWIILSALVLIGWLAARFIRRA